MWPPWKADPRTGHELDSHLDVWPDPRPADPFDFDAVDPRWMDAVASRRSPGGALSYLALPEGLGNSANAVACAPSDGSVWVGFGWGGFGRWNGSWWTVEQAGPPAFALQGPVRAIQIDRWASPRIVYLAHAASRFGPGGLTVYQGR
jgi:hypothetical protein